MRLPVPSTARTRRVILGGGGLLLSRIFSAGAGLLVTALVSRYLNPSEFGLWSILSGLPLLVLSMDLGVGNTLRNKMARFSADHAFADESPEIFFACLKGFSIAAFAIVAFIVLSYRHVSWYQLFVYHHSVGGAGWDAACAVSVGALVLFLPLSLGNFGLLAYQETHWAAFFDGLKAVLVATAVLLAVKMRASFLTLIAGFYGGLLISAVISLSFFLARRGWALAWPPARAMLRRLRALAPESSRFAVLQMSAGVILLTDTILVSWSCGLGSAGDYALVQKLYFYIVATESLLLTPLWSAYTEAHVQKDRAWIVVQLKRSLALTGLLLLAGSLFCWFGGAWLIQLWTRKSLHSPELFVAMTAWVWAYGLSHCLSVYLNAIGRLHRQSLLAGISALANIPLALFLGRRWGPAGVCWAGVFCILPTTLSNPLEVYTSLRARLL